jgi:hypothetical protein
MKKEFYTDYETSADTNIKDDNVYLHDWIFHYNPYANLWNAIPRNLYSKYWDNFEIEGILKSRNVSTLFDLLHKAKGNVDLINQLTNSGTKN